MKYKQIFDRMIEMERSSARNPNLMQTYEVMWKALKDEIQFDFIKDLRPSDNSRTIQSAIECEYCRMAGRINPNCTNCRGSGKNQYHLS